MGIVQHIIQTQLGGERNFVVKFNNNNAQKYSESELEHMSVVVSKGKRKRTSTQNNDGS